MQIKVIENALAMRLLVGPHLLQIPRHKGGIAMRGVIGADVAAIDRRKEILAPPPAYRSQCLRARIGRFDGRRNLHRPGQHFIVARRLRMHIAMRAVPQHRFVIEIIEQHAAIGRRAIPARQVIDPALHKSVIDGEAGIGRIVAGEISPVMHAVAAVRIPLSISGILRTIFAHLEATGKRMIDRRSLCHPTDEWDS